MLVQTAKPELQACAEASLRAQDNLQRAVLSYVLQMQDLTLKPICYLEHCLYDETPLHTRIRTEHLGKARAEQQTSKILCC